MLTLLTDAWLDLPAFQQDALTTTALLLPVLLCGLALLPGHAPGPLIQALLWRFRGTSLLFVLLIGVAIAMGTGLLAQERALRHGSAQAADKFDLVIGAPGSEFTLMLAAVYLQPSDVGLVDGATYAEIAAHPQVEIAAPLAFGDSYRQAPIVGTTADFVRHLSDDRLEGRLWQRPHEAVIGAAVPLALGDDFIPAHGVGEHADHHAHAHEHFAAVGRLAPTGTPWDRAIMVPVEAVWAVHGLANGHPPSAPQALGPPFDPDYFPGTPAVVVKAKALWANYALRSEFNRDARTLAFFPGSVLARLHGVMGDVRQAMSLLALVTQALVALSVLLGLFILGRLYARQTALLHALGSPRRFIVAVVWGHGAALLTSGALLGLVGGLATARLFSMLVSHHTAIALEANLGWSELQLVAAFLSLTLLGALLPALALLRQSPLSRLRV